jgi:tRNA(fMet)-specific endonuclease VapC
MTTFALDSDTTTLLLHGDRTIGQRAAELDPEDLAVTIVTVEEILSGWYAQIRRAKTDDKVLRAYKALQQAVQFFGRVRILNLDEGALQILHDLRKGRYRIGTNDLKMAAIVKRHGATLVTRNLRDFKQIPDIELDDWS